MPDVLPAEIGSFTALSILRVSGDTSRPAGKLPKMPPTLRILDLSSTGLEGPLAEDLFTDAGGLNKLQELRLVSNGKLGSTLPTSLFTVALQTLYVLAHL